MVLVRLVLTVARTVPPRLGRKVPCGEVSVALDGQVMGQMGESDQIRATEEDWPSETFRLLGMALAAIAVTAAKAGHDTKSARMTAADLIMRFMTPPRLALLLAHDVADLRRIESDARLGYVQPHKMRPERVGRQRRAYEDQRFSAGQRLDHVAEHAPGGLVGIGVRTGDLPPATQQSGAGVTDFGARLEFSAALDDGQLFVVVVEAERQIGEAEARGLGGDYIERDLGAGGGAVGEAALVAQLVEPFLVRALDDVGRHVHRFGEAHRGRPGDR